MKKTIIVLVLFVFIMGFANGLTEKEDEEDRHSGNFFYRYLKAEINGENGYTKGLVDGYIDGVRDSLNGLIWNVPDKMQLIQAWDIVGDYLEAHPETRHEHIFFLILKALAEKLPKAENQRAEFEALLLVAGRDKVK